MTTARTDAVTDSIRLRYGEGSAEDVAYSLANVSTQPGKGEVVLALENGLVTALTKDAMGVVRVLASGALLPGAYNESAAIPAGGFHVAVTLTSALALRFDGSESLTLPAYRGGLYVFDVSDSSNLGSVLVFSATSDGTNNGGAEFSGGVSRSGTPGHLGAFVTLRIGADTPLPLYPYVGDFYGSTAGLSLVAPVALFTPSLPPATTSTLGGVKVGSGLSVSSAGVLSLNYSYSLPTATSSALGGVKVGSGLSVDSAGVLSLDYSYSLPTATTSTLGGVKVGSGLAIDAGGVLSLNYSYSLPTATSSALGGIKVGTGLSIDAGGVLSLDYSYSLPPATTSTLGGVKAGTGLSVDSSGVLSLNYSYSLPPATSSTLGGVKVGSGLSVDSSGVLSLPPATTSTLGGVKVGSGLSVSSAGVLSISSGGSLADSTTPALAICVSANQVADVSADARALSVTGTPALDFTNRIFGAPGFSVSASSKLTTPASPRVAMAGVRRATLSVWYRLAAAITDGSAHTLVGVGTSSAIRWRLALTSSALQLIFDQPGGAVTVGGNVTLSPGSWRHAALVMDGDRLALFHNGARVWAGYMPPLGLSGSYGDSLALAQVGSESAAEALLGEVAIIPSPLYSGDTYTIPSTFFITPTSSTEPTDSGAGTAEVWTPALLALAFWYDGKDSGTLVTNGSGALTSWTDKSPTGANLTPKQSGVTLQSGGGVLMPGGVDGLTTDTTASIAEVIVAAKWNGGSTFNSSNGLITLGSDYIAVAQPGSTEWYGPQSWTGLYVNGSGSAAAGSGSALPAASSPFILRAAMPLGGQISSVPVLGTDRGGGGARGWNGPIFEAVGAAIPLSPLVRQKLEGYLAHKWGTTSALPSNHPYKSAAPIAEGSSIGALTILHVSGSSFADASLYGHAVSVIGSPSIASGAVQVSRYNQIAYSGIALANGVSDYTIEFMVNFDEVPSNAGLLTFDGANFLEIHVYDRRWYYTVGDNAAYSSSGISIEVGRWYKIVATRSGQNCSLYVDDVRVVSFASSSSLTGTTLNLGWYYAPQYAISGKIKQLRMVRQCLYTGPSITSAAFPSAPGTYTYSNWSPSSLPSSVLWLDLADTTAVATTAGGFITNVRDKSGAGNHVWGMGSGYGGMPYAGIINGKPCMVTNSSQWLSTLSGTMDDQTAFLAAVIKYDDLTELQFLAGSRTGYPLHPQSGSTYIIGTQYASSSVQNGTGYINGVSMATTSMQRNGSVSLYAVQPTSGISLGQFSADRTYGRGTIGSTCEIICLSAAPSTADRQKLEGYLAHKWGFSASLPSDHPYKSAPPA